jgi:hypothetical protein
MISISTFLLDDAGVLIAPEFTSSEFEGLSRRVQKTATLDGGVDVQDLGYTDLDRPVSIDVPCSRAVYDQLKYLIANYSELGLSTRAGFNTVALKSVKRNDEKITLVFELIA